MVTPVHFLALFRLSVNSIYMMKSRFRMQGAFHNPFFSLILPSRFIALCLLDEVSGTKIAYLVFSCPDSAPVRAKMIMSSAKVECLSCHWK